MLKRTKDQNILWESEVSMKDFEAVSPGCPFCFAKMIPILIHNSTSKMEDWIDIVGANSNNSLLNCMRGEKMPVPTGRLLDGHILENFFRDIDHTIWFIKELKR